LFIDEMREQEQYYQPDHWTSCQFSKGQARKPILGVRPNDAFQFCEWLTRRENGKWNFQLPNQMEADRNPLPSFSFLEPIGYWIREKDKEARLGNKPGQTSILCPVQNEVKHHRTLDHARDLTLITERIHAFQNKDLEELIEGFLSNALNLGNFQMSNNFEELLIRYTGRSRNSTREIVDEINRAFALKGIRSLALDQARFDHQALNKNRTSRTQARSFLRDIIEAIFIKYERRSKFPITQDFVMALSLFINLVTLEERIAGRSPAFEGIRLMKYREPS
jgi:hypothetical protein